MMSAGDNVTFKKAMCHRVSDVADTFNSTHHQGSNWRHDQLVIPQLKSYDSCAGLQLAHGVPWAAHFGQIIQICKPYAGVQAVIWAEGHSGRGIPEFFFHQEVHQQEVLSILPTYPNLQANDLWVAALFRSRSVVGLPSAWTSRVGIRVTETASAPQSLRGRH
jgi:hypothetical protein